MVVAPSISSSWYGKHDFRGDGSEAEGPKFGTRCKAKIGSHPLTASYAKSDLQTRDNRSPFSLQTGNNMSS
jgi:hypothetical protein